MSRVNKLSLTLPLILGILGGASSAEAFKLKSHVIIANQVVEALEGSGDFVGLPRGTVEQAVADAVTQHREYFRAGTLGPDVFPDMFAGQIFVHVNNMQEGDESNAAIPFEERLVSQWRSVDFGMYMFRRAWEYYGVHEATDRNEGLKALAFAYGYLGHMIGDGFAHSLVNEWAGGAWSYVDGQGVLFPLGEEIKHFAVEGLIDDMIVRQDDEQDLRIRAPYKFLFQLFTEEVMIQKVEGGPLESVGAAGAFAGPHYQALVQFRDELRALSNHDNWTGSELGNWALDVTDQVHHILSVGTDVGNPVADVEHFFATRAELFEVVLEEWIWLSECIAQNMIWTANLEYGGVARRAYDPRGNLDVDACEAINFEPDGSGLGSLYAGNLNIAAHGFYDDPGSIESNFDRMGEFLNVAMSEIISFDPLRDIGSLHTVASLVPLCEPVIEWGSCDNACDSAREVCTKIVEASACAGCPKENGHYTCSGWDALICVGAPHCAVCAGGEVVFEEVIDDGCTVIVNASAAGVCDLCSQTLVCEVWETTQVLESMLKGEVDDVINRLTAPLKDAVVNSVMIATFGPHYDQVRDGANLLRLRRHRGGGVWFVNAVYFYEDLRAGGLPYLYELFGTGMGVPAAALAPVASPAELANASWPFLPPAARDIWNTAANPFGAYSAMVADLWASSQGTEPTPFVSLAPDAWLNAVSGVPHPGGALASKFTLILDAMGMIVDRPGPTAEAFLGLISNSPIDRNNIDDVTTDLENFAPIRNAAAVLWLSLFDESAEQMQTAADPEDPSTEYSLICRTHPHIMCDGIASLDDPNHFGPNASIYDPSVSVPEHVS